MGENNILLNKVIEDFIVLLERTSDEEAYVHQNLNKLYEDLESKGAHSYSKRVLGIMCEVAELSNSIAEYKELANKCLESTKEETKDKVSLVDTDMKAIEDYIRRAIVLLDTRLESRFDKVSLGGTLGNALEVEIKRVLSLVEKNSETLGYREKLERQGINRSGSNSPRYIHNIDNKELVELYKQGWKLKDLAERYNITSPGIIERLKSLGEYTPKNKRR